MALYEATPIVGSKSGLGEGTLWDERRKSFLWVDVLDGHIKEYLPTTKEIIAHKVGDFVSYVGKRKAGGYVIALGDRLAVIDDNFSILKEIDMHIDREIGRTNDGNIDPCGCLWIGVAEAVEGSKAGDLRRIDQNFSSSTHRKNVQISNGIDWSLDGKIMYYIDSAPREISRYQFDPQKGEIVRELTAIDVSDVTGVPDGMCTDSLGNLWVAFWGCGQVRNYTPDGELLNVVQAPTALTTCPSFGGADLKTMFITSAQDHYQPEFAFDANNDKYGGMCFEVELPIAGKLDNYFLG
jgi:sugar lactone lactonase YvrE